MYSKHVCSERSSKRKRVPEIGITLTVYVAFYLERKLFSFATVFSMPFVRKCIGYIYIHTYIYKFRELIRNF